MPYLYQFDPKWADEPYAGDTISENGCGPTALSMVSAYLLGAKALNPFEIAQFSESNGYVSDGMTSWQLMTEGASRLGLQSNEVSADENAVRTLLENGHPIICSVTPGDFTTTGHFIVLCGLDGNGNALVHDPNSAPRSHGWPVRKILAQCANLWAFSL